MESRARITGYTTLLALLILAGWAGVLFVREALQPNRIIQVRFPQLGTLKIEDPVVQNGVPIGRIKSLKLLDGLPIAEIELFHRGFISSDSRFVDFNHSLMGARMVLLRPGRSSSPIDESAIQEGLFADGIAERIHRINGLMGQVATMRAQTGRLFLGSDAPFSPLRLEELENKVMELDRYARQSEQVGKGLKSGLQSWTRMGKTLRTGFGPGSGIDSAEYMLTRALKTALSAEQRIDEVLTVAEKVLNGVQDSNGNANQLLSNRKLYEDLEGSLRLLQTATRVLQNDGLTGIVKWRNIHFFDSKTE